MLSLVRDFARLRSKRFFSALVAPASHSRLNWSTSRRAYQMSSVRIWAKSLIASRYARPTARFTTSRSAGAEPDCSAGDGTAGDEALEVPLERTRQRLVEVVDAEHEPPVGRREPAEVGEVGVAAELHLQAGPWACRRDRRPSAAAAPR